MRILHVIPFFSDKFGGSVEITKHQIVELLKRGVDVKVLTTKTSNQNNNKGQSSALNNIIFMNPLFSAGMYYFTPKIFHYLNSLNFQILHGHLYRNFQTDCSILFSKLKKIPTILSAHGSVPYVNKKYIKKLYDKLTSNSILEKTDLFLAETNFEKNNLIAFGINPEKIRQIPNGVDTNFFYKLNDSNNLFKTKYNLENYKIITYVGRLDQVKGLFFLLKVLNRLMQDFQQFKLLLVGSDFGIKKKLISFANKLNLQSKILFLGFLSKEHLVKIYNISDIVILPSQYESAGICLLEAAACEKPVIGSNIGGIRDYILNDSNGFLINYGDIKTWKDKILFLLSNEDICQKFGRNGRKLVEKEFNWNNIGKLLQNLYTNLIGN